MTELHKKNLKEIAEIKLDAIETLQALEEARLKKWFRERNKEYWERLEGVRETVQLTK